MNRVVAILLALSLSPAAEAGGWRDIASGWREIQTPPGFETMAAPSGCATTELAYFLGSPVTLTCMDQVYWTAATRSLDVTDGRVQAANINAIPLATPVITPPVSPVLSKLTTITVVAGASLADGDYFTLSDGSAVVYEFDNDANVTVGRVGITFTGAESAQAIRDLVVVAINGSTLEATAIAAAADTLTVTSDVAGDTMGVNSENVADPGFLVPVWGEPTHATTYGYKVASCLASGQCSPSAMVSTATGHATLSAVNLNRIAFTNTGGTENRLWRTADGGTTWFRIYTGTALQFDDVGAAGTADVPPSTNETGRVTSGALVAGRLAIVGTGGQIDSDGGAEYDPVTNTLTIGTNSVTTPTGSSSASSQPSGHFIGYGATGLYAGRDFQIRWVNGAPGSGTPDAGIRHPNPGTLWFTDGADSGVSALVGSRTTALTDAVATPFVSFTISDGADYAGEITYKIRALKGTALQTLKGRVQFSATREGATYTVSVSEMGTQTLAAAAGTLTGAISIAGAAGVVTLSANFDTSQVSPDSFTLSGHVESPDAGIVVTWIP